MSVVVNIELFQKKQRVYKDDALFGEAEIENLPEMLGSASEDNADIYIGGPRIYTEQIKARVESVALTQYGNKPKIILTGE